MLQGGDVEGIDQWDFFQWRHYSHKLYEVIALGAF
jgi:hypothetical protein